MMFKPFKPPLIKSITKPAPVDIDLTVPDSDSDADSQPRPPKKRRLIHVVEDSPPLNRTATSSAVLAPRKPLLVVKNPAEAKPSTEDSTDGPEGYYMVLW
jgi:DNA repair and recombination protein RAD54B